MATLSELRENPQALRKFFIFGAVLLAALGWLLLPSMLTHHSADAHVSAHPQDHTQTAPINSPAPIAGGKSPTAGDPAPASGPAPAVLADPYGKLLGKWAGQTVLPKERGICSLQLEVHEKDDRQSFSGFSTLSCAPSMFEMLAKREAKKETAAGMVVEMTKAMNPAAASFTGAAQDGAILLHAVENVGVSETPDGCDMVSMTVREFGDGRISVKWQEDSTKKELCRGGEMLMTRK